MHPVMSCISFDIGGRVNGIVKPVDNVLAILLVRQLAIISKTNAPCP
jgi:hypothetical protein